MQCYGLSCLCRVRREIILESCFPPFYQCYMVGALGNNCHSLYYSGVGPRTTDMLAWPLRSHDSLLLLRAAILESVMRFNGACIPHDLIPVQSFWWASVDAWSETIRKCCYLEQMFLQGSLSTFGRVPVSELCNSFKVECSLLCPTVSFARH